MSSISLTILPYKIEVLRPKENKFTIMNIYCLYFFLSNLRYETYFEVQHEYIHYVREEMLF